MSNFIHEVEITNFKSIRHQKIEGCKRINVFIGYPNVGKSNVLEALSMVQLTEDRHKDSVHLSELIRLDDLFYLLFFDGNVSEPAIVAWQHGKRVVASYTSKKNLKLEYQQLISDSNSGPHWVTDGMTEFKPGKEFGESEDHKGKSRLRARKYVFDSRQDLNEDWRFELRSPSGKNLFSIIESNASLRKQMVALLEPYGLKLSFDKRGDYSLTVLKNLDDETIFLIPFHLIADTLQRLIFHKAAIASNQNTVLLFEEPEAHMFPPFIKTFTWDVISSKTNQFFITTHSPFVLDMLLEEAAEDVAIYLVGYKDGETTINILSDEDMKEVREYGVDLFFNLESYLKHGQSDSA